MKTKLSSSHAIFGQLMILLFFTPFNILLWYLVVRSNFSTSTMVFSFSVTALSALVVRFVFKTADVATENGVLVISKLFGNTRIPSQQLRKIGSLLVFGYYLQFENGKRVYVLFGPDEIISQATSSRPNDIFDKIKSLINQEHHV
jgi:hypothetical protein